MPLNVASLRHSRNSVVRSILHPTDLSEVSGSAFAHALRISVATKSKLHLLHVSPQEAPAAAAFPHARRVLAQWGLSEEDDTPWVIASKLGIEVDNTHIQRQEPVQGILSFLDQASCDLMVHLRRAEAMVFTIGCGDQYQKSLRDTHQFRLSSSHQEREDSLIK